MTSSTTIAAVVDTITHRDRGFTVLKIGSTTCSGVTGPVVAGLPVSFRVRQRSNTRYQDRYAIEARLDTPTSAYRRSCGVITWLDRGGLPMLGRLVRTITSGLGEHTAEVLLAGRERIGEIDTLDRGEAARVGRELELKHPAIYGAALLGEVGLEWAVELMLAWGGPDATALVATDPFQLVRHRVLGLRDANLIAEQLGLAANDELRLWAAGDALQLDFARAGDIARPKNSVTRSLTELMKLGLDRPAPFRGAEALDRLVAAGNWEQRGELYAPVPGFEIADELIGHLDWLFDGGTALERSPDAELPAGLGTGERAAVINAATHGLSLVETEAGGATAWFETLAERMRAHRRRLAVTAPDLRGSLVSPGIVPEGDISTADVVVVLDTHRYGYPALLRLLRSLRDGVHLVLAGDTWLWAPNGGGSVFGDLFALGRWPSAVIHGAGPASIFRKGGLPVHHPRLQRSDLDRIVVPMVRALPLPSVPKTYNGAHVLAGVDIAGVVGAGSRGEIRHSSPTEWRVAFYGGDAVVKVTDRLDLVEEGRLPLSLLPGIQLNELGMGVFAGVSWTRRAVYAALCAAVERFHFDDPALFLKPKDDPRRPNPLDPPKVTR